MKKNLLFIAIISIYAQGCLANCYNIRDDDAKNNCLAMEKDSTSYCYNIRNDDMKNYCLAKLKNSTSYCYNIRASDKKNECLAFIR